MQNCEHQLQKVYETNNSYLQSINSYLDSSEQLTSLATNQGIDQTYSPEQVEKIRKEEIISVNLIGDTLLKP